MRLDEGTLPSSSRLLRRAAASDGDTGKPRSASAAAGAMMSLSDFVPYVLAASSTPPTAPGTLTDSTPLLGSPPFPL
jgi:hypothetical protein